jgi:hypothetical protein
MFSIKIDIISKAASIFIISNLAQIKQVGNTDLSTDFSRNVYLMVVSAPDGPIQITN